MIKKIEHFWKGLSSDRTQISALPPQQYGDRFYHFIEGVTMSSEEAHRDAERRDQEMIEAQRSGQRVSSWNSRRKSSHGIPPMPTHLPPAPPPMDSRDVIDRATSSAARQSHGNLPTEKDVPGRVLTTAPLSDTRDSFQHEPVLPVVQEVGDREESDRPETPPKDKALPPTRPPPPTPPKMQYLKPDSADSGYGGNSNHTDSHYKSQSKINRNSLDKDLPPLPKKEDTGDSGVRMVA